MGDKLYLSMDDLAWHHEIGLLIDSLDQADFWLKAARYLHGRLVFDNWVALLFIRDAPPVIFAESDESDGSDAKLFLDYQKGLYLLDPFYLGVWANPRSGLQRLDEVAPIHFRDSEYYRRYFQRNIVEDEVQLNLVLDERRILCLSLGGARRFSDHDMGFLRLSVAWLLPLMRQRMRFETARAESVASPFLTGLPGTEMLTERESEVTQLMLSGCSTKEIARRLCISIETVRAHKKHIYAKLGVKTQSELFVLFWQGRQE
ncbi:response regulator transcription factor [Sodalis sp. RH24]|uniref:helix-turn-helix transcriptional regulator n=1 Tax=unclassified Sodalis (in: enterobacteria) TaxID=2636512 RepID=UPI003965BC0B